MPLLKFPYLVCLIALLAACGGQDAQPAAPSATDTPTPYPTEFVSNGALNYSIFCVSCHAPDARGIDELGFNLLDSPFVRSHTDDELQDFIIAGRPAEQTKKGVEMPPRGGFPNLTDAQILSIIAYLRSLGAVYQSP